METLEKFQDGLIDLIITTDALEEGIDIPACNTVLNFNCPLNLKSFIQRRGRARRQQSKFIIILQDGEDLNDVKSVQRLESELLRKLQDEERTVLPDDLKNDEQLRDSLTFSTSTGAQMTMGNAISHLYRFCSELPAQPYVSNKPVFNCEMDGCSQVQAIVRLPSNLDPSLHTFNSLKKWARKRWAKEDAALQAYKALYHAGLVNDYLLPLRLSDILEKDLLPRSHYLIPEQLDPWHDVALLWSGGRELFCHELHIVRPQKEDIKLFMILSVPLRTEVRIQLFLDSDTEHTAVVSSARAITTDISICQQATHLILQSVYGGHEDQTSIDYVHILVPDRDPVAISGFLESHSGRTSLAAWFPTRRARPGSLGLMRHVTKACRPLLVEELKEFEDEGPHSNDASLAIRGKIHPLTRRRNFLHKPALVTATPIEKRQSPLVVEQKLGELAVEDYLVDRLPSVYAEAAVLAPSIIHKIGVYLIAEKLKDRMFSNAQAAPFERMDLLSIAINPTDIVHRSEFRSMAFIGDTIAKFLITRQLFLHHTLWHEGLLTSSKNSIVSDAGLAAAVCHSGFGHYLMTTRFNGKRWRPAFVSTTLSNGSRTRQRHVGAATVADMAKALVGAAFLDNGLDQAVICIAAMIPKIKIWTTGSLHDGTYSKSRPPKALGATTIVDLEDLLAYTFSDKSLAIESMTHASCVGLYGTTSYRRLSFLGAAVIDLVVVTYLHRHNRWMSSKRLQSLKSAVTNNMYLAFVCLTFYREKEQDTIEVDSKGIPGVIRSSHRVALYNFIRSQSDTLSAKLSGLTKSFTSHLHIVKGDLWEKRVYPWAHLSVFRDLKVLSDIVQSVFGAIYVDSFANLQECEALAEKLGILPLLEHFIAHDVATDHPKGPPATQAQNSRQNRQEGKAASADQV
ncbi:dicer dimerization domain-containing protein [Aspergillus pseudotamarii]|uniref:Dicer dimerization domain-containing protein n=1 Tax=Aspergillus pseudotamarii TaxID=132259 RepID=A0A5N6T4J7_ASPPS|nr:dicer dimerization domain-containing protein [Aspergillus pseudotamarii]KAE8141228.1 dicer dimerization domain-containing protein [Aspergillus pseudotamarii]